jgi:hypothetical protein
MEWDLEAQIDSDNSARSDKRHPAMEGDGIGLSRGARQNMPEFLSPMTKLMPASFACFREQDHVSHGSDGNGQEGMLVRGLGGRRGFLRNASHR